MDVDQKSDLDLNVDVEKANTSKTFSVWGRKLASARAKRGMSQEDLARAIGRSASTIAKIEGVEVANIFLNRRKLLIEALGMSEERFEKEIAAPDDRIADALLTLPADLRAAVDGEARKTGQTLQQAVESLLANALGLFTDPVDHEQDPAEIERKRIARRALAEKESARLTKKGLVARVEPPKEATLPGGSESDSLRHRGGRK